MRVYGERNRLGVSLKAGLEIMRAQWLLDSLNHFFCVCSVDIVQNCLEEKSVQLSH